MAETKDAKKKGGFINAVDTVIQGSIVAVDRAVDSLLGIKGKKE